MTELLLARDRCAQCLTTRQRIVPGDRAAQIVRGCMDTGQHFVCHKSADDQIIHCRGVHDLMLAKRGGSIAYRIAKAAGIPVREVIPGEHNA